jgi:eukaryotic-like serine/threonine-protein kinase
MENKAQDDDLVMNLVELALGQPEQERRAYLQRACAGESELFDQAWEYVQWEGRMQGFLLEPLYSPPLNEHPFEPGELLDSRFRILREIAQGGMGVVYEAMDERLDRRIAIKCAKTGFRKRLPPEVRYAREITHPNVCKIFEIHTARTAAGEIDFVTMEYLEGETLADRLKRGPLPEAEARAIARQLCSGLAEAHSKGVIHGDLKSNNVILTKLADASTRSVITDFGMSRATETALSTLQTGPLGGTPDYMAPELLKGEKASVASDVYALGVMLHEVVSGRKPAAGAAIAVHPKWNPIVAKCLTADPKERYANATEIAQAFEPPRTRRWFLMAAAAVVLAVASGLVTYQRATAPRETIRLAVLPFQVDVSAEPLSLGLLLDLGERLSHVKAGRARLTLIPVSDALQNKVYDPARARATLGATHTLSGLLRQENGGISVRAYLTDVGSGVTLNDWRADYSAGEVPHMPVALAGMVTETLRLPPLFVAATVNAKAYRDWAEGASLTRGDPAGIDRALELLDRAVAADPDSPLTHATLSEAEWLKYWNTNDPHWRDRAQASLQKAEQRNPDLAAVRLVAGMMKDYDGRYEQAEIDLQRALDLEPRNGDVWRRLGRVYEHNNQFDQALAAYLKAIEAQPEYFKNYQSLGGLNFARGDYDETIRNYKRMIELAPDLADAHYALATPYLNLGRYADAEYELRVAIGHQETANAVEGLGLSLMYQGREHEAIPYLQRALAIGPKTSLFYLNLGTALRRAGFPGESREAYRSGLDLAEARLAQNPRDVDERSRLAYLCARLGEARRAESEAAQAVRLGRGSNDVRWFAALTYEVLALHDRTVDLVRDAPDWMLGRLNHFPDLADLQKDSRFRDLIGMHHIQ